LNPIFRKKKLIDYFTDTTPLTTSVATTTDATATTPTLPPGCSDQNFGERLCQLEATNKAMEEKIKNLSKENEDLRDEMGDLRDKSNSMSALVEELENKFLIWTTRPCSCV